VFVREAKVSGTVPGSWFLVPGSWLLCVMKNAVLALRPTPFATPRNGLGNPLHGGFRLSLCLLHPVLTPLPRFLRNLTLSPRGLGLSPLLPEPKKLEKEEDEEDEEEEDEDKEDEEERESGEGENPGLGWLEVVIS